MTTAVASTRRRTRPASDDDTAIDLTQATGRLRAEFTAVRLSFTWLGVRKTLSADQKAEAADTFGAEGQFLSAGKKLLDTRHPAYRAVNSVRSQAVGYWRGMSLPYPEPGLRLVRCQDIEPLNGRLGQFRENLATAVTRLDEHYADLKATARRRLGRLYNSDDYPGSLRGLFAIDWDFPAVEPPSYLRQLNPEIYAAEQARVTARFDEAVRLAEEAFTAELAKLVSHLTERLTGQEDGKPKVFRDSAISNLSEFFERFRTLSVRSNADLDRLIGDVQQVVRGVEPQTLRDNVTLRQHVAAELARVEASLDGLMVDRPRRNLIRRPR